MLRRLRWDGAGAVMNAHCQQCGINNGRVWVVEHGQPSYVPCPTCKTKQTTLRFPHNYTLEQAKAALDGHTDRLRAELP